MVLEAAGWTWSWTALSCLSSMIWVCLCLSEMGYDMVGHNMIQPYSGAFENMAATNMNAPDLWHDTSVWLGHSGHLAQLFSSSAEFAVTLSHLSNMVKPIQQRTYKNWLPRVHGMWMRNLPVINLILTFKPNPEPILAPWAWTLATLTWHYAPRAATYGADVYHWMSIV